VLDSRKRPIADMYYAVHILKLKTDMVAEVEMMMMMMMMMHHCIIRVAVLSSSLSQCSSQYCVPL